jgi:3-oxoacid CoA-transferase
MDIDLPGIYIDRIVKATVDKKIELLTLKEEDEGSDQDKAVESDSSVGSTESKKSSAKERRIRIAKRAAKEVSLQPYILTFTWPCRVAGLPVNLFSPSGRFS